MIGHTDSSSSFGLMAKDCALNIGLQPGEACSVTVCWVKLTWHDNMT